ncbi:MAG: hypothetical protein RIT17_1537 [Pseudomonadota bacterium]|jgi:methyl-accepting chemotaxis protein
MTRAIETFRAALKADKTRAAEQAEVVETLSQALHRLADGDLTHRIDRMPAGEPELLRDAYNASVSTLETMIGAVRRRCCRCWFRQRAAKAGSPFTRRAPP